MDDRCDSGPRFRPGLRTRLADILVVQVLRAWLEQDPAARSGWLGAIRDPQIGKAVAAIHRAPGDRWTLEALAAVAGMSRSGFSARFAELVGKPAMRYLGRWRMHAARTRLETGYSSIADLAAELGYESEAAFNRAFKRITGATPGKFRRDRREKTG